MSTNRIYLNGKPVDFTSNHYKGAGGEGTIYAKEGKAFKIYHDPDKCISEGKIRELGLLDAKNVLGPREPIHDKNGKPIGFWMPFVDKTEYLCKLFNKGFCETNGIGPKEAAALVARMQQTLEWIHSKNILVVDYNEMNFLTDRNFTEVFHIDVDCYQTPHYPATAIMASIRDPKVQKNQWSTESDWFSFGILACQLYIKAHPYKGRHPDHGKDWLAMMAAGVSIFNKATRMPPNTLDLSVIPKGHRKWLERIMEHGERVKPPQPDQDITPVATQHPVIVNSTETITIEELFTADDTIQHADLINGNVWVLTAGSLFKDGKVHTKLVKETGYQARRAKPGLCHIEGNAPAPAILKFNPILEVLSIKDTSFDLSENLPTEGFLTMFGKIYITNEAGLVEISPMKMGAKPIAPKAIISQIFHNHVVLDGLVVQDILGKCSITIPTSPGKARTHRIEQLDGHRILSGKHESGFAIIVSEKAGVFQRTTILFDKTGSTFEILIEDDADGEEPNFCVLDKGICVSARGDELELFANLTNKKVVKNSPVTASQKLRSWQNMVLVTHQDKLLRLHLK